LYHREINYSGGQVYIVKYHTSNNFIKVGARNVARATDQYLPDGTDTAGLTVNFVSGMLLLFVAVYNSFLVMTVDFRKAYLNSDVGDDDLYVTLDK
jgi:hypothetical protein